MNYIKSILVVFLFLFSYTFYFSQCCNTSAYASAIAPVSGTTTISTCNYLSEYSQISSVIAGSNYTLDVTTANAWVTVYSGSSCGTFIADGPSPLTFTAPTSGTYFVHWTVNSSCATAIACQTTTITGNSATCFDGIQNQGETGIDCGGPCVPCSCFDGIQNNGETGIDCGGPCPTCPTPCNLTASYSVISGAGGLGCSNTINYNQSITISNPALAFTNNFVFNNVPTTAVSAGTLTIYARGDLNSANEIWTILTELGATIGTIGGGGSQCNTIHTITIPLSIADLNIWAADGTITFQGVDLSSSWVNPSLCGDEYMTMNLTFDGCNDVMSCNGGTIQLNAIGTAPFTYAINNSFDNGNAGNGWNVSPAGQFNNPCDPSFDGGTYMWMGNTTAAPRTLQTSPIDVHCGGDICFWFDMATQGNSAPCEGPDLTSEGVYLEYSTTGGAPWTTIFYFQPNSGGSSGPYLNWAQYCFTIPPAAQTTSTIFQWWQSGSSGSPYDHWGIDNVTITSMSNCSTSYIYNWAHVPGTNNDSTQTTTISSTTTYNVVYTNGIDSCSTTVTVPVPDGPLVTATTTNNETCPIDCDGSASSSVQNGSGTAPYTYSWNNGATTSSINNLCPGNYIVTVTDDNGCTDSDTTTILPGAIIRSIISPVAAQCLNNNSFTFNGSLSSSNTGPILLYTWDFGDGTSGNGSNPTHVYASAGTYTVTLTVSDGDCSDVSTISVNIWDHPIISATSIDATCNGVCDGSISLNVNGSGGYSYSWNNGAGTSANPSNLCPGNYTVIVNDVNGCQSTGTYTISEPSAMTASTAFGTVSCNGVCDGAATINVNGGTPGYSYLWSNGVTTATTTGLCAGNPNVIVTDANGCILNEIVNITEPTTLTLSSSGTDALCNGACDGTATVVASGGTPGYTYSWDDPLSQTTATATSLCAGTYIATVVDANRCTTSISQIINEPSALTVVASGTNILCRNSPNIGSSLSSTVTGGTPTYSFSWDNGAGSTQSVGPNCCSPNTYTVLVTDANGCTGTDSYTVTIPPVFTTTSSITDASCNGVCDGSVTIFPSGATPTYTYLWNAAGAYSTTATASGLCAGNPQVTITDANGCVFTQTNLQISEPTAIILTPSSVNSNCGQADGSVSVSATGGGVGGYTYQWDAAAGNANTNTVNNLVAGTYTVVVTDANGCTETTSATINDVGGGSATTSITVPIDCFSVCIGEASVVMSGGTAPFTYLWSNGSTSPNANSLCAGTYTVDVTDNLGCVVSSSITLNEPTLLQSAIISQTQALCNGDCNGDATVNASGGTSSYTYLWNTGGTSSLETGLCAGPHSVTITDAKGCTSVANVTITEPLILSTSLLNIDVLCNGVCSGSSDLTINGGTGPYTYLWSNASTSEDVSGLCAGNYSVDVTDANGCTISDMANISEPTVLSLSPNSINSNCGNSDGEVSVLALGGTGPYTYLWDANAGNATTSSVIGLPAGTYTVIVTDANGCSETISSTIIDNAPGTASITIDNLTLCNTSCDGGATVSVNGGAGPFTYLWNNGETTISAISLCSGIISVDVTDANGCIIPASSNISSPSALVVSIVGSDALCKGSCDGSANVNISGGTSPYVTQWQHGPTAQNLNSVLCVGAYTVDVIDNNGCLSSANVFINEPSIVISSSVSTNTLCNGSCDGAIDLTVSGGTPNYTFAWNNSSTTEDLSGLCAGNYFVDITDANGCLSRFYDTINEPSLMLLTPYSVNSNCNQADGEVSVTVSGGTGQYTYLWDASAGNATTSSVTGLLAGTYNVTVTDANSCVQSIAVTIIDTPGGTITYSSTNISCNNGSDGNIDITINGGTAPFIYSWTGPNGYTASSEDIYNLISGTYDITVVDAVGCSIIQSISLTQQSLMLLNVSTVDVTCFGGNDGQASASTSGGAGGYSYSWYDNIALTSNIGNGPNVTGLSAITYYVQVTDNNGCVVDTNFTVGQANQIVVTTTSIDANCGQSDGSVSVNSNIGGSGVYVSEVWTNTSGTVITNINAVPAGTYTVVVTDNLGCTGSAIAIVVDLTGPTAFIDGFTDATCFGLCDGTASSSVSGGTSPYAYFWTPLPGTGQGTSTVTGLCAGIYTVDVTDANGCSNSTFVTINQPTAVNLSQTLSINASGAGICDGQASVVGSGGSGTYTYTWYNTCAATTINTSISGNSATGLCAGSYAVVATDGAGCPDTLCITITEPNPIIITITGNDALCKGSCDGDATATVIGGVLPYTYHWYASPLNTSLNQFSLTANNLCAGNYYIAVTDANGITVNSATYTVGEPTNVTATTSVISSYNGQDISCFASCDGSAQVFPSGGTSPYSYQWAANANNQTTPIAINLCAGNYLVDVIDSNGCIFNTNVVINSPSQISNVIASNDASCNGLCDGSATANTNGGVAPYSYLWNNSSFSTTSSINNLCAGLYNLTISDNNGCIMNDSISISEPIALVLGSTTIGSNCNQNDGTATVTIVSGVPSYSYQWDANANNQTTASALNLFAGCYDVVVTDGNACNDTLNICVMDLGSPTVNILTQTDVSCFGGCDGFAQIQVFGGTPPLQFSWYDSSNATINQPTASALNLCSGTYTGEMIDSLGCQASVNVIISQPPILNGIISSTTDVSCFNYCDGQTTVTMTGGVSPYTYLWNDPNSQTSASANNLCTGTYNVTITDANGCNENILSTISEPIDITSSSSSINAFCNTATGSATINIISGGVPPFTYQWFDNSGNSINQSSQTATSLIPGLYNYIVTDANSCTNSGSITVGNTLSGTASISNYTNALCNASCDGTASISMSGTGTAPYTYYWYDNNGTPINQDSITAINLCAGSYFCEVTDINGCISISNIVTILEPAVISLSTRSDSTSCFSSCDGQATVFETGGTDPYSFQWNDPLLQTTATAINLCAGTYTVVATDNNACIDSIQVTILEPLEILLDSSVTDAICGQANGQGCVQVSGGIAPYTFLWPDATTSSCHSGLLAGSYLVVVTDAVGCTESIVVEISDLNGPTASILSSTNASCYGYCDGNATVDMIGGLGTFFTVAWDNNTGNQTTPTASNLCAGVYTVVITDDLGCNASVSVNITEPDTILYITNINNPTCYGYNDGQAWVSLTGGTPPYSYDWRDNANNSIGTNNDSISGLGTGNYNLIITDINGCSVVANYQLVDPLQIQISTTVTDALCFGSCDGTILATANNGIGAYTYQWGVNSGSQTTQTAMGLCVGTYDIIVSDANGCSNTVQANVNEPTLLTSNITTYINASCNGVCDGFAQVAAQGGTPGYSYTWSVNSGSQMTQSATGLCAGNYTVTINDNNNCTTSSNVTITQPQPLITTSTTVDLSCYNVCIGQASVFPSGGTSPYTYLWDDINNTTTSSVSNLCAGTYSCIITDSMGCSITETIIIYEPMLLSMAVSITDANCGQNNGQICVNAIGGIAPYTYQWNDPNTQTTSCAYNLYAGCYTGSILDANGCMIDSIICINDLSSPTITIVDTNDVTCFGFQDGSIEFNISGGTGSSTLEWYDNNGTLIPQGTGLSLLPNISGGCYTIQATDAAGCISSLTACINEPNPLSASILNYNEPSCFGYCDGDATVAVTGGLAQVDYSYSWNDINTTTTALVSNLCIGSYTVSITDDNNCNLQSSIVINEPSDITTNIINVSTPSCYGYCDGVIEASSTGGTPPFYYSWSNANVGAINSNLCEGNYSAFSTDANGCKDTIFYLLTQPDSISLSSTVTVPSTCQLCNGEAEVFASGGTGSYTYNWFGLGNNPTSSNNNGLCAGTFQVDVTDANSCTYSISDVIPEIPLPVITSMPFVSPTCFGYNNGSVTFAATGNLGPYSVLWDDPLAQQTATATGLLSGNYCVSITDTNGCIVTNCVNITEPAQLNAIVDFSDTICYGDSTQIWVSGQGGTPPYSIHWQNPSFVGTGPITVIPIVTTDYCATSSDANGCISTLDCATITVSPPLSLNSSPNVNICSGDSINIWAVGNGGDNPANYIFSWIDEFSNILLSSSSGDTSIVTVMPSVPTWYYITLTDGCSIDVIDSIFVELYPTPQLLVIATDSMGCVPLTTQFIINTDIGDYFEIDVDCDGVPEYSGANNTYTHTYTNSGVYNICVNTSVSSSGCTNSLTATNMILVYDTPNANFSVNPSSSTIISPYINITDMSTGGLYYTWNFGDGDSLTGLVTDLLSDSLNSGTMTEFVHTYSDTGNYTISLTIVNAQGCSSTYYQTIYIEGAYTLFVPSAFSPNGDGKNDVFIPEGINISGNNYELYIFNRWGELIFKSLNPEIGWDGTYKNKLVKVDAYVWVLKTMDVEQNVIEHRGHVTVVR